MHLPSALLDFKKIARTEFLSLDWIYHSIRIMTVSSWLISLHLWYCNLLWQWNVRNGLGERRGRSSRGECEREVRKGRTGMNRKGICLYGCICVRVWGERVKGELVTKLYRILENVQM